MLRGSRRTGAGPRAVREQRDRGVDRKRVHDVQEAVAGERVASGASAGVPRFALFDVHTDLAGASHNEFGDVKIWKREPALAARAHGSVLVRCGSDCTFGPGWLAFAHGPALSAGDVASATARRAHFGWSVVLTGLTRANALRAAKLLG